MALDGRTGKNLINQPLNSLRDYLDKPVSNNEQLLYRAVLGHVKRATGKEWKKHQTEEEFENAVQIAFSKVEEVRAELEARRRLSRN